MLKSIMPAGPCKSVSPSCNGILPVDYLRYDGYLIKALSRQYGYALNSFALNDVYYYYYISMLGVYALKILH